MEYVASTFRTLHSQAEGTPLQVGIRYGHFYAYGLAESLEPKLDLDDVAVRISLVHYNTVEEVEKIVDILKEILV